MKNGADEIDMVINIGWVKDKKFAQIEEEIRTLKKACGTKILKVIIETCLLTEEEKINCVKSLQYREQTISRLLPVFQQREQHLRI